MSQIKIEKTDSKPDFTKSMEFIKPFIAAVHLALSTQANTPVKTGKPFMKKEETKTQLGVVAVINLISDQFIGSISILFSTAVFLKIYENMLGEKITQITKESEDAAAELLNIIFGLAKMKLNNEKGYTIQKAIPTVLTGENLHVATSSAGPTIVLPFETSEGEFYVEVLFEKNQEISK
jgi:chemotaxis protein CheX